MKTPFTTPSGSRAELEKIISECIQKFPQNKLLRKVDAGECSMSDYHGILKMIFYQTFHGPSLLALAGANCPSSMVVARDYLFKHSAEEMTHWTWVINDLERTGYAGPDPRSEFPPEPCQAYISFNYYMANRHPLTRLAIATMLESLGATCGKKYAIKFTTVLKLQPDQASFFFGHGDTDVAHTKELWDVLNRCELTPSEWGALCFAASTAFKMYYRMYDEAVT